MGISGWHLLVLLGVLIVMVAIAVGVVLLTVVLARKIQSRPGASAVSSNAGAHATDPTAARLAELNDLAERGLLSSHEYEAKRAAILDRL